MSNNAYLSQHPLSKYAQCEFDGLAVKYFGIHILASIIASIVAIVMLITGDVITCVAIVAMTIFVWIAWWLLVNQPYTKTRNLIFKENDEDYRRSLALKECLQKFVSAKAADFPISEKAIGSRWKPFRVEHFVSNSIKGVISGRITISWGSGSFNGSLKGVSTPDLLDSSAVLFLKDGNKTLRVLLPSPRATKELLTRMLEAWLRGIPSGTYTKEALRQFETIDDYLPDFIYNPSLLDKIDASCDLPISERPVVKVMGEGVQDGIAIASALEVGEEMGIFLPSGFVKNLADSVSPILQKPKEVKLIEVMS